MIELTIYGQNISVEADNQKEAIKIAAKEIFHNEYEKSGILLSEKKLKEAMLENKLPIKTDTSMIAKKQFDQIKDLF